ncbi:hypothetical protein NXW94_30560 [Bacteroides ovatus]|nr:hypothetical protein [Bacteroides ovatus]
MKPTRIQLLLSRLSYTDQGNENTTIYAYTNNYRNSTYWLRDGLLRTFENG